MPAVPLSTTDDQFPAAQLAAVRRLLGAALPGNVFYARKLAGLDPRSLDTLDAFTALPFTTKAELIADQSEHPPYGTNLSFPPGRYTRFHQTSGSTSGRPLHWLDTPESWDALTGCWATGFRLIGLTAADRLYFPFSFGPFLGFWTAFEAAARAGHLVMPGGGLSSTARLRFLLDHRCTVLFATPTYALHLAEVAAKDGFDIRASAVRALVVAGEPGGTVPGTRERLEAAWGARVFDHYGLTEVGPVATEARERPGEMDLLECDYLAEVVEPQSGAPVAAGEAGELVLTTLGRTGSPLVRYRTGDIVRLAPGRNEYGWRRIAGGILGRADDMIHVRGNNVYPSAIESVVRRFPAVAEYRVHVDQTGPLADLRLEVEPQDGSGDGARLADAVARAVRDALLFRVEVTAVPPGTLPRFEMKAARVVREVKSQK